MESSTVLAFRIFVMLSCLIVVPMAAIFGSEFPDVVKTVLVDRIVAWSTGKSPEAAKPEEAPPATATPLGANNWEAPRWNGPAEASPWQPPTAAAGANQNVIPAVAASAAPHAGNQSASFADPQRAVPARPSGESGAPVASSAPAIRPASAYPGGTHAAASEAPAPTGQGEQHDFESMGRKLRQYGAVYYLLETYGNQGQSYRFHCSMALANNPNYTRYFEATDTDALGAMSQVLEKVEAWRAGRLQ